MYQPDVSRVPSHVKCGSCPLGDESVRANGKGEATGEQHSQRAELEQQVAKFICKETAITEEQALALIRDLGMNVNSLLREARKIKRPKK